MPNQRPDPSRRPRPAGQPHSRPQARAAARRRAREAAARRRAAVTGAACLGILALVVLICVFLLFGRRKDAAGADTTIQPAAAPAESVAEPTPEPTPAMSEEEQRIAEVMATASANATKDAPVVTDPATWNERGKALMDRLSSDEFFVSEGIDVTEKEGFPYLIAVNRSASTVTVYTLDEEGRYTVPYMAMVCSAGKEGEDTETPLGFYATPVNYDWRLLAGPSYGQYATRIWDAYLFHSVPYYTQHKDDVEYDQFNELGSPASLGCVRLMVNDVKWIYDNCEIGTRVIVYDDPDDPGPMGKPGTIYTDPADETLRGWDPTDPDPENPWDDKYLTGTTIRSQAAWDEWNAAQADGRWADSLTPTDLQGWSTDSSVEGTRG
ncbi:L,D-transpeptidase [uncultured Subdoligranulum sp.]|uniref:L,D-transpeptidase n=1 Tax=uncultured Subdoligranulum sp. TaxID=512298 RepID=UPI0025EDD4FA|nr:L,D-transpeptidase family protein [uncultured Subdoligranulum sp.]